MDENRLFENKTEYVHNMGALVKRDRNHPAVVIWSFCNEGGCEGSHEQGGPRFKAITTEFDGSRPVLANMFTFNDLLSNTIDVQGFSHQSRAKVEDCHARMPDKVRRWSRVTVAESLTTMVLPSPSSCRSAAAATPCAARTRASRPRLTTRTR
jgi:hypothetical protein